MICEIYSIHRYSAERGKHALRITIKRTAEREVALSTHPAYGMQHAGVQARASHIS